MYFILPTIALFTITAAAGALQTPDDVSAGHLRGGELTVGSDQRDLVGTSSSSAKLNKRINLYACRHISDFCFEPGYEWCAAYSDSHTYTSAVGTDAYTFEELCVYAECYAAAEAFALAYVEVRGAISVDANEKKTGSALTEVDLSLKLASATLATSLAATSAAADASTSATAVAYTDVNALCSNSATRNLPICAGASSGSVQAGTADAGASSTGFSGAVGGSNSFQSANVDVVGSSINTVKTIMFSFAESFASSSSVSVALADACLNIFTADFSAVCLATWDNNCGGGSSHGQSFCNLDKHAACNGALALGIGEGFGVAAAFGAAAADAAAHVKLGLFLKVVANGSGIELENHGYGEACVTAYC